MDSWPDVKPCSRCGRFFALTSENFAPSRRIGAGYYPWCRACTRDYQKDIYRTLTGQLAHRLRSARVRASQFRVPFELNLADLFALWEEQQGCCAVSGLAFVLDDESAGRKQAFRPSVDRIRPELGYVRSNVRLVLTIVNFALNNWAFDDFVKMCEAVASRDVDNRWKGGIDDPT